MHSALLASCMLLVTTVCLSDHCHALVVKYAMANNKCADVKQLCVCVCVCVCVCARVCVRA